jgi:hypothetical protein
MDNLETEIIGPLVNYGNDTYGKSSQALNIPTTFLYEYRSLNAQAPSNLNSRNKFYDILPREKKGLLRKVYLQATLTNSGAAAVQLIPYFFIIDFVIVYFDNQVLGYWYAEDLFHFNNFKKTDYEVTGEQAVTNISEAAYTYYNSTVAAGASTFMSIDISPIFESLGGLLVDGFIPDIRIEFNTRPSTSFTTVATSSGANITCSGWALNYGFELLDESDYMVRLEAHRNNTFMYKYVEPIRHISAFPGLNSTVQYTDTMKDINAKVNAMIFTLRPQSAENENLYNYYPLTLMYLKDNTNRIIGDQEWTAQFVQQNSLRDFPLNFYLSRVNVYPWVFSRSILNVMSAGMSVGALYFTGQSESFWFSASGTLSNTNCEMVISAWVETHVVCNRGLPKISRITGF